MSSKYPILKPQEIIRALKKQGSRKYHKGVVISSSKKEIRQEL